MSPLYTLFTIVGVLFLGSTLACVVAFRWTLLSTPRRFGPAVGLAVLGFIVGYVGLTHFRVTATKAVNGQFAWRFDSKWLFIITVILSVLTLGYTLWKQRRFVRTASH